ncbi:hypothetical protein [Ferrimonas kyonanensis]|uniref:hypothetical protein n=1 Tax=Ferrimonas kyonanensis TaxID=364763 RepID=UPI0003F9BA01|nr:hypothetical protein [Ferrimonas kyonanensis]
MITSQSHSDTFDLTNVAYVHRVVVGSVDPQSLPTETQRQQQMALINRCLSESPKGKVLGMERSFSILRISEHQVVLESVAYHIGFTRQPYWLIEMQKQQQQQQPKFEVDPDKVNQIIGG